LLKNGITNRRFVREKLINSAALGTIELSTGLQISVFFTNVIAQDGKPIYKLQEKQH
jgi:hypothetical protein